VRNWKLSVFGPLMRHTPLLKVYRYDTGIGNDIKDPEADKVHVFYKKTPTACVVSLLDYLRHVREDMKEINAPIVIVQARDDHTVHPENANVIYNEIASADKEIMWVDNSYHVVTVDYDKKKVFEKAYEFIKKRS
jgi:carboxylesterase